MEAKERRVDDGGRTNKSKINLLMGKVKRKRTENQTARALAFKHMSVSIWKEMKVILHPFIIINPINHLQVLSAVVKTT